MNKIYTILCVFVFFACSKEQTPITPSEEPKAPPPVISEEPKPSNGNCSVTALNPPAFNYDASLNVSISGARDTLYYDAAVNDYGPIIKDRVNALYWKGGGTLFIAPGNYPVKSSTNHTFYPTSGIKKLAIQGIADASGTFPHLFDKDNSKRPHSFIEFSSTPADHIEFYVSNIEITGNNIPLDDNHPFYMKNNISAKGIFFGNIKKGEITNTIISDIYGDAIQIYNWADNYMTDYNIGQGIKVNNCFLIDNWSDNGNHDSGDGIIFYHVNEPTVTNTVISNNYTLQKKYGRGGIVIEAGTKNSIVQNNFIQGYRSGVICERGFGGHLFQSNSIYNNQQTGITFAHAMSEVEVLGAAAYRPNRILNNTFEFHQVYGELGANLWSFIVMNDFGYALAGTEISGNNFIAHEKNCPSDKDSWWTVGNEYNFFIKTNGQQDLIISDNIYNSPSN